MPGLRRSLPLLLALLLSGAGAQAQDAAISAGLARAFAVGPRGGTEAVWVFFRDKGPEAVLGLPEARARLTPHALSRRALRGRLPGLVGFEDLALDPSYVAAVGRGVVRVRHLSRWLNAVSVQASQAQVLRLARLPFVRELDLVRRFQRAPEPVAEAAAPPAGGAREARAHHLLDYGESLDQLAQIHVPEVHDLGLSGQGVIVASFDAGFDNLSHEAFAGMRILAAHDFVNGDDDVADGTDQGRGSHGTSTLSVLGGYSPGHLIGPAYGASFVLAKTENTASETPIEEDNWAAAAEWAEALGVDVISSSLGYTTFDAPYVSYTPEDLNGETAISTRAAELAADRGVVVVNSAGNAGLSADHNTLVAPSDGRRVIAVAAVVRTGGRSMFSSVGPSADGRIKPDVAALGTADFVAQSRSPDAYGYESGTSFSCPLVAGVVALVLEAHPEYTVDQVIGVLHATSSQAAAPDNLLGWGIVNALVAIQTPPPDPAVVAR